MDPPRVRKAERLAQGPSIVFILIAVILVLFTLFGTGYVYSKQFFTGWVVVSLIWIWARVIICVVYPVVESAVALRDISRGLWMDVKALMGVKKQDLQTNAMHYI
jgi:TM2 domain-containing membrane protein YozV